MDYVNKTTYIYFDPTFEVEKFGNKAFQNASFGNISFPNVNEGNNFLGHVCKVNDKEIRCFNYVGW